VRNDEAGEANPCEHSVKLTEEVPPELEYPVTDPERRLESCEKRIARRVHEDADQRHDQPDRNPRERDVEGLRPGRGRAVIVEVFKKRVGEEMVRVVYCIQRVNQRKVEAARH